MACKPLVTTGARPGGLSRSKQFHKACLDPIPPRQASRCPGKIALASGSRRPGRPAGAEREVHRRLRDDYSWTLEPRIIAQSAAQADSHDRWAAGEPSLPPFPLLWGDIRSRGEWFFEEGPETATSLEGRLAGCVLTQPENGPAHGHGRSKWWRFADEGCLLQRPRCWLNLSDTWHHHGKFARCAASKLTAQIRPH